MLGTNLSSLTSLAISFLYFIQISMSGRMLLLSYSAASSFQVFKIWKSLPFTFLRDTIPTNYFFCYTLALVFIGLSITLYASPGFGVLDWSEKLQTKIFIIKTITKKETRKQYKPQRRWTATCIKPGDNSQIERQLCRSASESIPDDEKMPQESAIERNVMCYCVIVIIKLSRTKWWQFIIKLSQVPLQL